MALGRLQHPQFQDDACFYISAVWRYAASFARSAAICRSVYYQVGLRVTTSAVGGSLKLAGVQKRVETMLTMTGAQNFIEVHPDESSAVKSFGA